MRRGNWHGSRSAEREKCNRRPCARIRSLRGPALAIHLQRALAALACSLLLLWALPGTGDIPEVVYQLGSTADLHLVAEGHPELITLQALTPSGQLLVVDTCPATTTCTSSIVLQECGTWQFPATVQYAHEDPMGGGPYVWGGGTAAVVVGCSVFADGFETGDTSAWSLTQGGSYDNDS